MVVLLRQGGQQQLCEVQRTNKQPIKIPVARRTYLYQLQYYHCAPKACASRCLDRLTGSGYQKIGCLRPTFEDYLRGKRRLVCTVYSTKSCLTRHRYRRITPLSRSIRVLVRGPLSHLKRYVWVLQNCNSDLSDVEIGEISGIRQALSQTQENSYNGAVSIHIAFLRLDVR